MSIAIQPQSEFTAEIIEGGEESVLLEGEVEISEKMGSLNGKNVGKYYTFISQSGAPSSSQTVSKHFSETKKAFSNPEKICNKKFYSLESKRVNIHKGETRKKEKLIKTNHTAQKSLASLAHPLKAYPKPPMMCPKPRKSTIYKMSVQLSPKGHSIQSKEGLSERKNVRKERMEQKTKPQTTQLKQSDSRELQNCEQMIFHEQEKADDRQEQRNQHDEEEGFAQKEEYQQQNEDRNHTKNVKVEATENKEIALEAFFSSAAEESKILSEFFNRRVNNFDVLLLFMEVMKLSLKGREQERMSRMEERELQLEHIQNMVDNFKQQGKWMFSANLVAGVLSIVSGAAPIIGHLKGEWILDKLSSVFSRFQGMNTESGRKQFFKSVTKITFAMSEMQKSTGQIQNTFAESANTYDRHMAEIRKSDWEEDTRTMDELKDMWKNMEQFLHSSLQMQHDAIRQLYNA